MATLNVGRVRLLCKGEYSPESAYDFFDWVTYDGSSYVVTAPTGSPAGVLPTDSNYWSLLASKGETGEMGEPGAGVFAGQLVMSLVPIFSAGLHLLDGSLLRVGGIYDDFITGVAVLRVSHPALFVTEEEWQASVSAYGVCGKFVYTEGVSLRIPKVTGFVEGTLDVTALGSLVEAGLPNIEGRFSAGNASLVSGALYNAGVVANGVGTTEAGFTPVVGFSAANSSPVYGNSGTVQPQAIKGYMYMVVATSVKTEVEVDIDNIAQELSDLQDAIDAIPEQVNSDWEEEDETTKAYIKNKPVVMTGATAETAGEQGFVPAPAAGEQDSVLKGDGTWGSIASRNIGETVFSLLPQTDAGLHLLDGSFLPKGGIYDAFIEKIGEIHEDSPQAWWRGVEEIIMPTFSSNSQDGISISDSRGNTTKLQAWFNGTCTTETGRQVGDWATFWIDVDYGEYTFLPGYGITADADGDIEYPSAWTVMGTNDNGETWETIDTQSGVTFSSGEGKYFSLPSDVDKYKRYRIVFSDGVLTAAGNGELQSIMFYAWRAAYEYTLGPFYTEDQWQACVEKYGVCGKFVYTDEGIRLPKITGFIEGTLNANALGDLVEAGLPNIWGQHDAPQSSNPLGAFQYVSTWANYEYGNSSGATNQDVVQFNAAAYNSIYGNSSTVQPQAIKGYLYMVVATSTKTNVQVDIDNIATDLNGKADKDLSNVTSAAASNLNAVGTRTVTETYSDGTNWYRKWSDGWIEQGGYHAAGTAVTVTLHIPFDDTGYCVQLTGIATVDSHSPVFTSRTTTTFLVRSAGAGSKPGVWFACGYGG